LTNTISASASAHVGDILEEYARRGVFSGFSRQQQARKQGRFLVQWHRKQRFDWVYDPAQQRLRVVCVLPAVTPNSPMHRDLKAWLKTRQNDALPEHRRCDKQKVTLKSVNRGGNVSLTATLLDGDIDYGVRKMVALVNEIYLDFLSSGLYFEWMLETFDLDPDNPY
jgi:hypothetical protein